MRLSIPMPTVAAILALGAACSSGGVAAQDSDAGDASLTPSTDAADEVAPSVDAGLVADVGFTLDGCLPAPVSALQPVGIHAEILPVCSDAQIRAVLEACVGDTASADACRALHEDPATRPCASCILTAYSATPVTPGVNPVPPAFNYWGPVIIVVDTEGGVFDLVNTGACVALADPSLVACARAQDAVLQCDVASCAANCRLPRGGESPSQQAAEFDDLQNCIRIANATGCADLVAPCVGVLDASPAAFCVAAETDPSAREKLVRLQCGLPDAGPDAGDAGDGG